MSVEIVMSDGQVVLIDAADAEQLPRHSMYVGSGGYVFLSVWAGDHSQPHLVHLLIMGRHPGKHVDHENGNKLDLRRTNLRVVTYQQNQVNRHHLNCNNTSGVRGVTRRRNRWIAQIMVDRQQIHLGMYGTIEEATEARRLAETQYFGELCPTSC